MEAQQCVKLSLTNRSFGLIRPSAQRQEPPGPQDLRDAGPARCGTSRRRAGNASGHSALRHTHQAPAAPAGQHPGFLDDLVVMARGQTPDPIPNSAVKTLSADGTAS